MARISQAIALTILVSACSVPERYPPGGPYCVVLYADYSFKPARLLAKSRSDAMARLREGRTVGVAMVGTDGLIERTRECAVSGCSGWKVYEYGPKGELIRTHEEEASAGFGPESCVESPPQSSVKLPM